MSTALAHPLAATTTAPPPAGTDWETILAVAIAIFAVGYMLSIWAHPQKKCRLCNGRGRHRGSIFWYASRPCRACGGRRYQLRLGTKVARALFATHLDR
jgi:DnaJ-class molecular chaperone